MTIGRIERREPRDMLGSNRLKLGTFGVSVSHGCAVTLAAGALELSWPTVREIVQLADEGGFEIQVPVARWRGFGGPTNFNGESFDTMVWATGVGMSTRQSVAFSTTHVPTIHPVLAAKQCATADHFTGGRFGLNVVCGWSSELEMFAPELYTQKNKYEYAEEWLGIVRRLWTEDDPFDFEGRFFRVTRAISQPKPLQSPHPPIMNAGSSEAGARFAAKHADIAFAGAYAEDFDTNKKVVDNIRGMARTDFGREPQVWCGAWVVCRPTEKEAQDYAHYYIHEKGDWEAAENLCHELGVQNIKMPPEQLAQVKARFVAGWGGLPLVGTPEQIVDKLIDLSHAGFDGVVLSWLDYAREIPVWVREVMPLLEQAGLRGAARSQ